MKKLKTFTAITLALAYVAAPLTLRAEDKKEAAKAYPLTTCVVSGEKLGEMGDPYVFKHEGKEVKLCCKSCLKKFNAEPAKYLKKIEEAEKAAKK